MRGWLTVEVALGALLVTSFACVGLVALWAATSRRHWFLRVAAVLAFLSPLLMVPANELFLLGIIESASIAVVLFVVRWWRVVRHERAGTIWISAFFRAQLPLIRFSLTSLLLTTLLVAGGTWLGLNLPQLNLDAWSSVALMGATSAVAVLVGAGSLTARRKSIAWPIGIALCIFVGGLMAWFDSFVPSITHFQGWPPEQTMVSMIPPASRPVASWFIIPVCTAGIVLLVLACGRSVFAAPVHGYNELAPRKSIAFAGGC